MILISNVGCGKTHLSCSIGHRLLDRWDGSTIIPFHFISEGEIYRTIIATYSYGREEKTQKENEDDILRRLINYPLLIIDDLAKETRPDMSFVRRIMFAIIDGRDKANKPVVISTNKTMHQLESYLGENGESPCCDRLYKMAKDYMWQIEAPSYRANPF